MRTLCLLAIFIALPTLAPSAAPAADCRTQPAPKASDAPRLERAMASDGLRVSLSKALDTTIACVWSADGVDAAGVRTVAVKPCPGGLTHCALLALEGHDQARKLDLRIGSAAPVRVTVPPRRADVAQWLLYLLVMLGFLASLLLSTWVAQRARIWRIRRAWEGIDQRLRLSKEDRPEIRLRIRAILRFVHTRIFRKLPSLHDLELFEERLLEAEQLSTLSERKTLLWTRAEARQLPPSVSQQFNTELRLFDRELLQLALPFEADELEAHVPGSLARAEALLNAAKPSWRDDNQGLLDDLKRASTANHQDAQIPTGSLEHMLTSQLERETTRLRELSQVDSLSPLAEREVDLRLDVWRCVRHALHELKDELMRSGVEDDDRYFTGDAAQRLTEQVRITLLDWRRTDLSRLGPDDARKTLWWRLRWARDNHAIRHWISEDPAPQVRLTGRLQWRTYTPELLTLKIDDRNDFADAYYWRSKVDVAWRSVAASGQVVIGGRAFDPTVDGEPPQAGEGWVLSQGPSTVVFAMSDGDVALEAWLRIPQEGGGAPSQWRAAGTLKVQVHEGIDEGRARQYFFSSYARLVLSLTANVTLASVIVAHAQAEPVVLLAGIKAFMLPLAVDHAALATLNLPGGVRKIIDAIWKALPKRGRI
jgi:hypothetical protein